MYVDIVQNNEYHFYLFFLQIFCSMLLSVMDSTHVSERGHHYVPIEHPLFYFSLDSGGTGTCEGDTIMYPFTYPKDFS